MAKEPRALTRQAVQEFLGAGQTPEPGKDGGKPGKDKKAAAGDPKKRVTMVTRIGNTLIEGLRNELTSSSTATRVKGFTIGMVAALVGLFLTPFIPGIGGFENKFGDIKMGLRGDSIPASPNLVHLDIDGGSLDAIGRWPWPRKEWAGIVRSAKEAGVDKLVFDVEFSDPQPPETSEGGLKEFELWKDAVLSESLKSTGGFVLGEVEASYATFNDIFRRIADCNARIEAASGDEIKALREQLTALNLELEAATKRLRDLATGIRTNDPSREIIEDFERRVAKVSVNHDELLARAIREAGNVYLPVSFSSGDNELVSSSRAVEWSADLAAKVFAAFDQASDLGTVKEDVVAAALVPHVQPKEDAGEDENTPEKLAAKAAADSFDTLRHLYLYTMVHRWYANKPAALVRQHMAEYTADWFTAVSESRTKPGEVFERLRGMVGSRDNRWGSTAADRLQKFYSWYLMRYGREGSAPWTYDTSIIEGYDEEYRGLYDPWAKRAHDSGRTEGTLHHYRDIEMAPSVFQMIDGAANIGLVIIDPDEGGVLRRVPLFVVYEETVNHDRCLLPHITFQALLDDIRVKRSSLRVAPGQFIEFTADSRLVEMMRGENGKKPDHKLPPLPDNSDLWKTYQIHVDESCSVRLNWFGDDDMKYPQMFGHLPVAALAEAAVARRVVDDGRETWERSKALYIGKALIVKYEIRALNEQGEVVKGGEYPFYSNLGIPFSVVMGALAGNTSDGMSIQKLGDNGRVTLWNWLFSKAQDFLDPGYAPEMLAEEFRTLLLREMGYTLDTNDAESVGKHLAAFGVSQTQFESIVKAASDSLASPLGSLFKKQLSTKFSAMNDEQKRRYVSLIMAGAHALLDADTDLGALWNSLGDLAVEVYGKRPEAFTDDMADAKYAFFSGAAGAVFGSKGKAVRALLTDASHVFSAADVEAAKSAPPGEFRSRIVEGLRWELEQFKKAGATIDKDVKFPTTDDEVFAYDFLPAQEIRKYRADYVSTKNVFEKSELRYRNVMDKVRPQLDGSMALIGAAATALGDLVGSPMHESIPGPSVHTNTYNTVIQKVELVNSPLLSKLVGVLLALIVSLAAVRFNVIWGIATFVGILAAFFGTDVFAQKIGNKILESTSVYIGLFLPFISIQIYRYGVEYRAKNKIKDQFGKFLDPDAVKALQNAPPKLGGDEAELAVYFSDIAGFTSISESMSAPRLIDFLNDYMGRMTAAIKDSSGYVDKFIGDAVMAVWGAPRPVPDYAQRACKAAVRNCQKLAEWNRERVERGELAVGTRVGIATGPMVAGMMG
ncbi:MAG: CHASE2 domain-containing protein, partial [Planctomycetaceae bacterium]|nr:CHASE2 domain-containing protein [Planctomycetaceae bacterium]